MSTVLTQEEIPDGRCIIFFFKHEFMVKDAEKLQRETILKIFANKKCVSSILQDQTQQATKVLAGI